MEVDPKKGLCSVCTGTYTYKKPRIDSDLTRLAIIFGIIVITLLLFAVSKLLGV